MIYIYIYISYHGGHFVRSCNVFLKEVFFLKYAIYTGSVQEIGVSLRYTLEGTIDNECKCKILLLIYTYTSTVLSSH